MTGLYRSNSDIDWYSDAIGYDLEQDSQWDEVDPSGFYPDESLSEWPRPYRSVTRPNPVHPVDFDPAGSPDLPTESHQLGDVPALAGRVSTRSTAAPATPPPTGAASFLS